MATSCGVNWEEPNIYIGFDIDLATHQLQFDKAVLPAQESYQWNALVHVFCERRYGSIVGRTWVCHMLEKGLQLIV